jgi:ferric-chelate reductase
MLESSGKALYAGSIDWFAPFLMDIATVAAKSSLELHISVFVTCLCDPEAVPPIPNMDVTITRPSIAQLLNDLIDWEGCASAEDVESKSMRSPDGGVAVCASGPASLTIEAQNTVAKVGLRKGLALGGISLHTETFCL